MSAGIGSKRKLTCESAVLNINNNNSIDGKPAGPDGKDHFFQPHLKSQVTQKLVNQQSEDAMRQVCQDTMDKLKCGVSDFYKGLGKENENSRQSVLTKPVKKEVTKPSS